MSSNAFAGLGSRLYIQQLSPATPPNGKAISGITKATPGVVTAAGHGLLDGMLVTVSGVAGSAGSMADINGSYYAVNITANSFSLMTLDGVPVNTSTLAPYTSGGMVTPTAYLPVPEARSLHFADTASAEIDVTTMLSTSKEYLLGLQDAGEFSFEMNYVPFDPATVELRQAKADAQVRGLRIDFHDGSTFACRAFVKTVPFQTDYQTAVTGSATVKITGVTLWLP